MSKPRFFPNPFEALEESGEGFDEAALDALAARRADEILLQKIFPRVSVLTKTSSPAPGGASSSSGGASKSDKSGTHNRGAQPGGGGEFEETWDDGRIYVGTSGVALLLLTRDMLGISTPSVLPARTLDATVSGSVLAASAAASSESSAAGAVEAEAEAEAEAKALGALDTLDAALLILRDAQPRISPRRSASFLQGLAGVYAVEAVVHHRAGRKEEAAAAAGRLTALWEERVSSLEHDACEILYGRSGYLYSLLFVLKHIGPGAVLPSLVEDVVDAIVSEGLWNGREYGPFALTYFWSSKLYLGGAHGLAGILLTLLHAEEMIPDTLTERGKQAILSTVDALLDMRFPSGNFPSSCGSRHDDMVQWCHGAPGFIPLLAVAARHADPVRAEAYNKALTEAADVVWKYGLLRKGVGLCHGIGGNGFALLTAYQATGDAHYLRRAKMFASFGISSFAKLEYVPDSPYSLFEGMAGFVAFLDALAFPNRATFPGYEL